MDWLAPLDGYCERLGPGLLAEPLNLFSNAAFLVAALLVWPRARNLPMARALTGMLALIGIGSALFHSFANRLTALADVLPILGFILLYLYAASRDFLGLRPRYALLAVLGFFPFTALILRLVQHLAPWLGSSTGYVPIPLLILIYAALLRHKAPATARGMALGAGLLVVSLAFRTLDLPACTRLPQGLHPLWHLLNAAMLGWMIALYCRHRLAGPAPHR